MNFQPGQSGNPGGRPQAKPFKDALNEVIEDAGEAGLKAAALALLARANSGDVASLKELPDRIDGKVPQVIGGDFDMPGHVQISWIQRTIVDPAGSSHTPYGKPSEIEGSETPAVIEAADNENGHT